MSTREFEVAVEGGVLAGVDFGGDGPPVLLVHGSGHNAAAWRDAAAHLVAHCHPVAFDLRGHGQSTAASTSPDQYWRDIAAVVARLGWERPVLVGHSTGGYAMTAVTASGLVEPAALCVVDGVVLDDRVTSAAAHAVWRTPESARRLRATFGYGLVTDDEGVRAEVERRVRTAPEDPLDAGARPDLVREVARRSFARHDGNRWRRPSTEEIAVVSDISPDDSVLPSVDVYERIRVPLTIVLADAGFYAERRFEVQAVVDAAPGRRLVEIDSGHNVPMTRPAELAAILLDVVHAAHRAGRRGYPGGD
ncbi:alpha/beta fold hydrolase [Marinactinospora thermotolerans]|uniref:alpha/beta fold hydrolase n=1 Tax=Marinactinospora thermotolerans TaxID=531310 RepID=UPI00099AB90D|nr:alpha/beta hydrolase [Marinactinospora thermotolerans]